MSVHTWADGFGIWMASVPEHAYSDPAGAARRAIRRELVERESPSFDPRVIGVRLHRIEGHQMIYRETLRGRSIKSNLERN